MLDGQPLLCNQTSQDSAVLWHLPAYETALNVHYPNFLPFNVELDTNYCKISCPGSCNCRAKLLEDYLGGGTTELTLQLLYQGK